jgi:hypothetical protein
MLFEESKVAITVLRQRIFANFLNAAKDRGYMSDALAY